MMIAHKNAILQVPVGIDVSLYSKLISLRDQEKLGANPRDLVHCSGWLGIGPRPR